MQISTNTLEWRRTVVFVVLAGLFLGSLTMLNILGTSRFIDLSFSIGDITVPFNLAVGVLPYPITFLCTDLISELYGKKKANLVVWVGLLLNLWVIFILWLGGALDAPIELTGEGRLPLALDELGKPPEGYVFYEIRYLTFGATLASMAAYLAAQFVDVQIFHWLKKKTRGRMLWLRNNLSTMTSQMVDTVLVILITYYWADVIRLPDPNEPALPQLFAAFILPGYVFKLVVALIDTLPFYWLTGFFKKYLRLS